MPIFLYNEIMDYICNKYKKLVRSKAKSMYILGADNEDLIQEGMNTKLLGMQEDVRGKFRGTLSRIVNDGANGLICLIL